MKKMFQVFFPLEFGVPPPPSKSNANHLLERQHPQRLPDGVQRPRHHQHGSVLVAVASETAAPDAAAAGSQLPRRGVDGGAERGLDQHSAAARGPDERLGPHRRLPRRGQLPRGGAAGGAAGDGNLGEDDDAGAQRGGGGGAGGPPAPPAARASADGGERSAAAIPRRSLSPAHASTMPIRGSSSAAPDPGQAAESALESAAAEAGVCAPSRTTGIDLGADEGEEEDEREGAQGGGRVRERGGAPAGPPRPRPPST